MQPDTKINLQKRSSNLHKKRVCVCVCVCVQNKTEMEFWSPLANKFGY